MPPHPAVPMLLACTYDLLYLFVNNRDTKISNPVLELEILHEAILIRYCDSPGICPAVEIYRSKYSSKQTTDSLFDSYKHVTTSPLSITLKFRNQIKSENPKNILIRRPSATVTR